jgi:hypothetical protein
MNSSPATTRLIATVLFAAVATLRGPLPANAQPATDSQAEGAADQSQLKWKPHRTATASPAVSAAVTPDAPQAASTPADRTLPPASVGLPDNVPTEKPRTTAAARSSQTAEYAPLRGSIAKGWSDMGDWFSTNRVGGPVQTQATTSPAGPSFAERMMRTPQGEAGRPILARETGPGMTSQPVAAAPLGGGLAPRYVPGSSASGPSRNATSRPDRLAMNGIDGIPSVMTRNPQAAAIDASPAPSRLPQADGKAAPPSAIDALPTPGAQTVDPPIIIETSPMQMDDPTLSMGGMDGSPGDGMWMGQYPAEMHVDSFYDDPYACDEEGGLLPMHCCDGRICSWMRQFGKPYYGWRWYRDFTASVGVTSFQNEANLGLLGNYGVNEYLNWSMPLWNAFGLGWQVGVRGVQSNFQSVTIADGTGQSSTSNSRDQVFVTTGLFTRAFQGRGLQGGAAYDYLRDNYYDNIDVSQVRGELSYVWGYHEFGFWGAFNMGEQSTFFGPVTRTPGSAGTLDLYTGFYRLQFGDANEWKVWGGATAQSNGIIGSSIRAPMNRSFAIDGTFTYVLSGPSRTYELDPGTTVTTAPSAWNVSVNLVYYPAGRSRRSLASPYRPLFEVADNGSMIRALSRQ